MTQYMNSLSVGAVAAIVLWGGGFWFSTRANAWLKIEHLRVLLTMGVGYLVGMTLLELLPEAFKDALTENPHTTATTLFLGFSLAYLFQIFVSPKLTFLNFSSHEENHDHEHGASCSHTILSAETACSAISCFVVCAFFDGIALSSVLLTPTDSTPWVLIGLMVHTLPEGVLVAALALGAGADMKFAKKAVLATAVAVFLGTLVPFSFFGFALKAIPFTAGIFIFVAITRLLPAFSNSKREVALLSLGAVTFLIMQKLFHPAVHLVSGQ